MQVFSGPQLSSQLLIHCGWLLNRGLTVIGSITEEWSKLYYLHLACVAGVNGEGEGEREKNGVLRARDEGTPATKTPFFHLRPPIFM